MSEKIRVRELTKIFGQNPKKAIPLLKDGLSKKEMLDKTGLTVGVNRCSFDVEDGELFVIMGLSGSGKSTLIRLINRMIEPTYGDIFIDDENISELDEDGLRKARREKMSMVFQNFALFPHYTILENAAYGLSIKNGKNKNVNKKAKEALKLVGLEGYEDQYPDQLSGGMQQRVGLARALATDTDVLIMDEAFSALDPLIRKEMQDELVYLQSEMKKTVLFITHDLNEALKIGDKIAVMKDGSILQIDSPEQLLSNPKNDFIREFVQDVDRTKVLTASNIMIRPDTININRHGPKAALSKMLRSGNSSIFVVNNKRELLGYVLAEDASNAYANGQKSLDCIIKKDMMTIDMDYPLEDIVADIQDAKIPISVIDGKVLKGIIIKGTVLAALSKDEVRNDE
ncbi:glycine betaine/L-proline ABC transporter ATP-binding protein [Anaerococcus porci]|uniref:quaternary amine ABC transporter ATP-binding protein n=1 Tax=Anaerococcus porci TaxID=2652269 RepID=UPI002A758629|nr:glycine betaine/L-proline ABC transporter ATP-binding protein [Anaerococcus porci]MDY3006081.1 glycine betaine/L-proline ABC transporter ATP-binding protein [Anaerococcus porci]